MRSDLDWGRVVERSETGWGVAQRLVDNGQHAVQIPIDFIVPKTQYAKALVGKVLVPLRVTSGLTIEIVLAAINLDNNAVLETDEIYNIIVSWGLSTKVEALLPPRA